MKKARIIVEQMPWDDDGKWGWNLYDEKEIIAMATYNFKTEKEAIQAAQRVKRLMAEATVPK